MLTINSKVLAKLVTAVTKAMSSSAMFSIYQQVRLVANNDILKLTATDGDHTIVVQAECNTQSSLNCFVLGSQLAQLTAKLPDTELTLTSENNKLVFKLANSKTSYKLKTAEDEHNRFPVVTLNDATQILTIEPTLFKTLLKQTDFASILDKGCSPAHFTHGVYFTASNIKERAKFLDVVGTDAHRMALAKTNIEIDENFKILLPTLACKNLHNLISDTSENVYLYKIANKIIVHQSDLYYQFLMIDVNFPDYSRIINNTDKATVTTLDRKLVLEALNRLIPLAKYNTKTPVISIKTNNNELLINFESDITELNEVLSLNTAEELDISLNPILLADVLKNTNFETLDYYYRSDKDPLQLIANAAGYDYVYVLMPVRR